MTANLDIVLVPFTLAEIVQFLNDLMVTRYFAQAGMVLLVYDWIITFDEEVNEIWPAKLSVTKVVFLSNRYINIIAQTLLVIHLTGLIETKSISTCKIYIISYGIEVFLTWASVHLVVLVRARAIWNGRRWISIALGLAYTLYTVACVTLMIFTGVTAADKFIYKVDGTCISFTSPTLWYVWVASFALECVMFAFTLVCILRNYSGDGPGFAGLRPLARKLLFSALVYISFSTLCHVSNMIMWAVFWKSPINMLAVTFTCCLMNLASQRFVLDLRRFNCERIARTMGSGLPHIGSQSACADSEQSLPPMQQVTHS